MEKIKKKTSWQDVTISEYKKILDIMNRPYDSDLEKKIAVCALLNGLDERDMYEKSVIETRALLAEMDTWFNEEFKFNLKWHLKKMTINGKKCRVYQTIESLTMAQYLDFTNYWENRDENMGKVLACFIVPEDKQYNEGYDAVEFAQELEDTLSIEDWNSIAFFLLKQWLIGIRASVILGAWTIQKMIWKTKDKTRKKQLRQAKKELIRMLRSLQLSS